VVHRYASKARQLFSDSLVDPIRPPPEERQKMKNVIIVDHPLVQHKLTLLRRKDTSSSKFRSLVREIGLLLAYELTRDLPLAAESIETPITAMESPVLAGKKLCLVSILRAGNGLLDGVLELIPSARVGHIGIYREPSTRVSVEYYCKLPRDMAERLVIAVDPLLATANSAIAAIHRLKEHGATHIKFACLLAAPQGLESFAQAHPDVSVIVAAIDEGLDENGFIVPGVGDAGDRLFGTQ
jgi:uracil phosphoribosyltransferase